MAARINPPPLQERASDWNRLRLRAGLSIRILSDRSGVNRYHVSLIDQGRLVPSPDESAAILAVLRPEHPGGTTP